MENAVHIRANQQGREVGEKSASHEFGVAIDPTVLSKRYQMAFNLLTRLTELERPRRN